MKTKIPSYIHQYTQFSMFPVPIVIVLVSYSARQNSKNQKIQIVIQLVYSFVFKKNPHISTQPNKTCCCLLNDPMTMTYIRANHIVTDIVFFLFDSNVLNTNQRRKSILTFLSRQYFFSNYEGIIFVMLFLSLSLSRTALNLSFFVCLFSASI